MNEQQLFSGIGSRFEISASDWGVLSFTAAFKEAEREAVAYCSRHNDVVIYDRMARHGQWQTWKVTESGADAYACRD